jgi:hypothetical protein
MVSYKVSVEGSPPFPVSAPNIGTARNHAARGKIKVEKLSIADAMAFGKAGVEMQFAGEGESESEAKLGEPSEKDVSTGQTGLIESDIDAKK